MSPIDFFSSVDRSRLDPEVASFITEEILSHPRISTLSEESRPFQKARDLINNNYPYASMGYFGVGDQEVPSRELLDHNLSQINIALKKDPFNRILAIRQNYINLMIQTHYGESLS